MDIQEQLRFTIYSLTMSASDVENTEPMNIGKPVNHKESSDGVKYFLEEIYHTHSRERDYLIEKYDFDRRIWLGSGERMMLEQARKRARSITMELETERADM